MVQSGLTGVLPDLEQRAEHWRKGQSAFWRKGDIVVYVRKDKRLM